MAVSLLVHPNTRRQIKSFASQPPAAILVTGQPGSGKKTIALSLAARILNIEEEKLANYPYFTHITKPEDKQEIGIESVRKIIKDMRLKPTLGIRKDAKRVFVIEGADSLSEEAQNALLKTIEEPGEGTVFILTAESEALVLPTITSRSQKLAVLPVAQNEASAYFRKSFSPVAINSAWQLSQGSAGLMKAILNEDNGHPLKQAVESAKDFLRMGSYDRVIYMDKISSDKAGFFEFLDALNRALAALHNSAAKGGSQGSIKKISQSRRLVLSSMQSLKHNTSPKLVGLNLAVNLPL